MGDSSACAAVEPLLSAWLDGELTARTATAMAAHVAGCAECEARCEELAEIRALVRNLPVRALPQPVPVPTPPQHGLSLRGRMATATTLVAIMVGLVGGAVFSLGTSTDPAARTVHVPIDVLVVDHLVHSVPQQATTAP